MIGIIAFNLIPQYKKLMMKEISADYFKKNKVDVYAPELASLHYCRKEDVTIRKLVKKDASNGWNGRKLSNDVNFGTTREQKRRNYGMPRE